MPSDLHTVQTFDRIFFSGFSNIENSEMKPLSSDSFLLIATMTGKYIRLDCTKWKKTARVIIGSNWIMYGAVWRKIDIDQFE